MLRRLGVSFAVLAIVVSFCASTAPIQAGARASIHDETLVAQAMASYIPWYLTSSPWPTPVPSADAAIGGAFGVTNLYNVGASPTPPGFPIPSGLALLGVAGACYFICYGAPGMPAHHMLAYGNDIDSESYTTQGAPDDCMSRCPGGISNQVFSVSVQASPSPPNGGFFVAVDGSGNLGVKSNVVAGAAIVAGAGLVNPGLTNGITSLSGGIRPNGATGGYAPEAFPSGATSVDPKIVSASCTSLAGSTVTCTFPNSFSFSDSSYNCTVTAQGSTPIAVSYVKNSTSQITIHFATGGTFSYICMD